MVIITLAAVAMAVLFAFIAVVGREPYWVRPRVTMKDGDWRIGGQEFLKGVTLVRRAYRRYPKNPTWDHDHCALCGTEFRVEAYPDVLHEGYCTEDEYHWVCATCFDDLKDTFGWRLRGADA